MKNSYRYFKNINCKYFPCHKIESEDFNCLFCFCPLYYKNFKEGKNLHNDCGGKYSIIINVNGKYIKDCSECKIPHIYEGYEYIIKKLRK